MGFYSFSWYFSVSFFWDVESQLSADFLGALGDQQLLVVEGSGVPGSPGVFSQMTWHGHLARENIRRV